MRLLMTSTDCYLASSWYLLTVLTSTYYLLNTHFQSNKPVIDYHQLVLDIGVVEQIQGSRPHLLNNNQVESRVAVCSLHKYSSSTRDSRYYKEY